MTVTFSNLSGTRENLDKTISYLLSDNWTAGNITGTITPDFQNDTDEPDNLAREDNSAVNQVRVNFSARRKYGDGEFDFNGDDKHTWSYELFIECQGESLAILTELEDEVHRILWENRPNGATRLAKSGVGGADSEIAYFEDSEPEFERLEPEGEDDQFPTSQAILECIYYKFKS